jgi:hypothetical protein
MNFSRCILLLFWCSSACFASAQASVLTPSNLLLAEAQVRQPASKKPHPVVKKTAAKPRAAKARLAAKTREREKSDVIATPVPSAKLDLHLPKDMIDRLQPGKSISGPASSKPLLPAMFGEKPTSDSPFQLNGRLLSNEMQLQRRSENQREVEGAALEFQFKQ